MKKFLGILLGMMLCVGLTAPAMADLYVYGEIEKDKYVDVEEYVTINKTVTIDVLVDVDLSYAAEANIFVNQGNAYLYLYHETDTDAEIIDSINANTGIVGVNQAPGDLNNQANVVALASTIDGAFVEAQDSAEQYNAPYFFDDFDEFGNYVVDWSFYASDILEGSVLGNQGIVGVNQAAGQLNNQLNDVALAAGLQISDADGFVALSEADLGQFNGFNEVYDYVPERYDGIYNSINGNSGIVGVNQSSGLFNNQANKVSMAVVAPAP